MKPMRWPDYRVTSLSGTVSCSFCGASHTGHEEELEAAFGSCRLCGGETCSECSTESKVHSDCEEE